MPRPLPILALVLSALVSVPVSAAGTVGFVDMQKVLEESRLGQRLQEELRVEFEPRGRALAEEEAAIIQLRKDLERDSALMSNEQVKKAESEIESRIRAYQEQTNAIQQEILKVQQAKGRDVIEPAREAIKTVAAQKKLSMVVEPGMAGLLYIDEALDVTTAVITELDAKAK
ncbi:MAG: OmpH family outer membrane protein [Sphingobacteriia bacterium]|nr:OmpH family outer membrane protein [Sphingobacteriia bacterium]NCC40093.1 OmpH family outer membrane protein [Gammaproteobacteria bacterium]